VAGSAIWLPLAVLGLALAWMIAFVSIDFFIIWMNAGRADPVFELNSVTGLLLAMVGFGLGVLGALVGDTLRMGRSGWLAGTLCLIVILAAIFLGELFYITASIYRQLGIFNLNFALKIMPHWFSDYGSFEWILRFVFAVFTWCGCLMSVSKRRVAALIPAPAAVTQNAGNTDAQPNTTEQLK
jgi:hypothetical protein